MRAATDGPASNRPPHLEQTAGMDLGFDPHVENAWLNVQRVAWCVMTLVVLAGLAGVFGRGPLATANASSPDGSFSVRYERFTRFRTPTQTILTLIGPRSSEYRVHVSASLLAAIPVQSIDPRPVRQIAAADGTDLVFAGDGTPGPATIAFTGQPAKAGPVAGTIALAGEPALSLHQFVWP